MTEVILAVISIVAAPAGAVITAIFLRRKYDAEVEHVNAETRGEVAGAISIEIENARKVQEMLIKQIQVLENEVKYLRKEVQLFKKAVDRVTECSYAVNCPVRNELQNSKAECSSKRDEKGKTTDTNRIQG
jgi:predicted  nucleic acid-binding Zn-ribbon protein